MLPKVSSALSKFIQPVSSSGLDATKSNSSKNKNQDSSKKTPQPKLVLLPDAEPKQNIPPTTQPAPTGLIIPFLSIVAAVKKSASASVNRIKGLGLYAKNLIQTRKNTKNSNKGLMLDQRAE